eukprot:g8569.t1
MIASDAILAFGKEEILADLHSLLADLGPQVAAALGLIQNSEEAASVLQGEIPRGSVEVYAWARWILQERGLQFLAAGGDALEVLAPGLELVPRNASGGNGVLRLERREGSPALVLSADRSLQAGEDVTLWHKGFACSQGFRLLMGVDDLKAPEKTGQEPPTPTVSGVSLCSGDTEPIRVDVSNPWESVEVLLRLPVSAKNTSENAQLWQIIEALEAALQASRPWQGDQLMPGDSLPPDYGWRRVEVLQKDQQPETTLPSEEDELLEVQVRLPLSASVPTSEALQQLGLLILHLARTLQWILEDYPSHAGADARQLSRSAARKEVKSLLPRRVRGLLLVAAERQLIVEASAEIWKALEAMEAAPGSSKTATAAVSTEAAEAAEDAVIVALVDIGCEDRLMYFSNQLVVQQKYLTRFSSGQHPGTTGSAPAKIAAYDVLVIPLEGWLSSSTPEQLCIDLVGALQALVTEMGQSVLRVVLLSSLSIGPGSSTYRRDTVNPPAAALGVVRSARAELPQLPILAQCLMAHNRDVVYRQGRRWLPRLDLSPNMPVYSGRVVPQLPPHVTETGVALVTGGVGGIGLAAAEALVELGMKRLVLTSRQGVLPNDQGAEQRVQALKSAGAAVFLHASDVAKESSIRELLESIQDNYGPLRIVVHASGTVEDRPFIEQDAEAFHKALLLSNTLV